MMRIRPASASGFNSETPVITALILPLTSAGTYSLPLKVMKLSLSSGTWFCCAISASVRCSTLPIPEPPTVTLLGSALSALTKSAMVL